MIVNDQVCKTAINTLIEYIEALKQKNAELDAENERLTGELAKDTEIEKLHQAIDNLHADLEHYGIPNWTWRKLEKDRISNNIDYWDYIEIEELPMTTAYTGVKGELRFTEYC